MADTRLTGKAGAAVLGSVPIILTGWDYEEEVRTIETIAGGDTWVEQATLQRQWRATIRSLISVTPPYAGVAVPVGTTASMELKVLGTDTNGIIEHAAALVRRARISLEVEGVFSIEAELEGASASTGTTVDTTPAT